MESPVRLECRISAEPPPKVEWYVDGDKIIEGKRFQFVFEEPNVYALCISKCAIEDEGEYTCKASNTIGSRDSLAELTVDGKISSSLE